MSSINEILNLITESNKGGQFINFSNNDKKTWLIPKKNTKTALSIYQPSSLKGKLLKRFLPFTKNNKLVQKKLNISVKNYRLQSGLMDLLKSVFKTDNIEFAIFCGTPSKHQKITIQLFKKNNILGYCKISNNIAVKKLFVHEEKILNRLNELGIKQIPNSLFNGVLNDNLFVFIQNTIKTTSSKVVHQWQETHWQFLTKLHVQTKQSLLFEETEFYNALMLLKQNTNCLKNVNAQPINKAITKVTEHFKNKQVCFSAYHADFTPWNMFKENGELFVFDFEYAKMTYPPYLDWFHFFTQSAIFENQLDASKIYDFYCVKRNKINKYINPPDFYYLCYLLDIVGLYVERDKDNTSTESEKPLSIWLNLIERL